MPIKKWDNKCWQGCGEIGPTGHVKSSRLYWKQYRDFSKKLKMPPSYGLTTHFWVFIQSQFSSVQSLSPVRLCDPMNHITPGLPVHHNLPDFTQTFVHRVRDAIQPSHPRSSPSLPAPSPSQHQRFSSESTLCMRWPKYWSFSLTSALPKNTQDWSPLEWIGWISLQSKGLSRVFSNTTALKHQFFGAQLSSQSNSHMHTWPLEKPLALTRQTFVSKVISLLFNMLSRLVITFLPRSKCLFIS